MPWGVQKWKWGGGGTGSSPSFLASMHCHLLTDGKASWEERRSPSLLLRQLCCRHRTRAPSDSQFPSPFLLFPPSPTLLLSDTGSLCKKHRNLRKFFFTSLAAGPHGARKQISGGVFPDFRKAPLSTKDLGPSDRVATAGAHHCSTSDRSWPLGSPAQADGGEVRATLPVSSHSSKPTGPREAAGPLC